MKASILVILTKMQGTKVKIFNKSKKVFISKNAKFATSIIDRSLGLLLRPNQRETLIFKTRFGIHTFFLKKEIDVLILDKNLRVAQLKRNLSPNRFFFWNPKYYWVVELPKNTLEKSKPELFNIIEFQILNTLI